MRAARDILMPAHAHSHRSSEGSATDKCEIFLGGSCNPTTWRQEIAIPLLEANEISFYNPQVEEWHEGLIALENQVFLGAPTCRRSR